MKRAGFFSLESMFGLIFVLIFAVVAWSASRIFFFSPAIESGASQNMDSYQSLFLQLRDDFRWAAKAEATATELTIHGPENSHVTYTIASGTFSRATGSGPTRLILSNLKGGGFHQSPASPRLVSVWFLPQDQQSMPFFTSFAIRGEAP